MLMIRVQFPISFLKRTLLSRLAPVWGLCLVLALLLSACGSAPTSRPAAVRETGAVPSQTSGPAPESTIAPVTPGRTPTPTITPEPVPTLGVAPQALQGATVTFWHPWSGPEGEALRAAVETFNRENKWDITVAETYAGNYNELYAKMESALQEGSPPQLVVGYNYQLLAWEAELADLNPFLNEAAWGLPVEARQDFYPVFFEQDVRDGKRLGFPAQRSGLLLYYNTSWAEELGFDSPPGTPEEFKEQACAAARANRLDGEAENDGTGGWVVNTSPAGMMSWMYAFGGKPYTPDGERYQFDTPQAAEALGFLKDLYDNGCAWKLDGSDTADAFARGEFAEAEFAARQALFQTGSLADLPRQAAAFETAGSDDAWTVIGFPSEAGPPVIVVYGPSFAIFEGPLEDQLAAWVFIRWLVEPAQQASLVSASSTFPTRATTLDHLEAYAAGHPQWAAALELLSFARTEPPAASWSAVRWVLADVGTQVFRSYFTADRIPATLELMDETAAELREQFP